MCLQASGHFRIDADKNIYPKKQELVDYFLGRRFEDGSPISSTQAKHLATVCRPRKAMDGGNS
jgi:hypothetical protein